MLLSLGAKQLRTGVKSTPVDVKNEKGETVKVLMRSDTQYIGLDFNALLGMANGMNIPVNQTFFENLHIFERAMLDGRNAGAESGPCSKDDRDRCIYEMGGEEYLEWKCSKCEKIRQKARGQGLRV